MKDRKLSFPNWLLNSQLLGVDLGSSCAWRRCDSLCRKRFRSCLAPGRLSLSLSMKMCAQRKAGRRQRTTLPIVPCGSSPVVRLYLGKTEAPEEEAVSRSTARKVALVPFFARPKPKIPFLGLTLLRNQTETLSTQEIKVCIVLFCVAFCLWGYFRKTGVFFVQN